MLLRTRFPCHLRFLTRYKSPFRLGLQVMLDSATKDFGVSNVVVGHISCLNYVILQESRLIHLGHIPHPSITGSLQARRSEVDSRLGCRQPPAKRSYLQVLVLQAPRPLGNMCKSRSDPELRRPPPAICSL